MKNPAILATLVIIVFSIFIGIVYAQPYAVNRKFAIEKLFSDHYKPSTMTFLGDNDLIVLDRDSGYVYRIVDGAKPKLLLDVNVATVGYRGLLGVTTSTNEKNITNVFLYYTESKNSDGEDEAGKSSVQLLGNRVYKYDLIDNKLVNPRLLLNLPTMPGPRHMGGVIAIGPDSNLYVSVGDMDGTFKGENYETMAQNYQNSTFADGRSGILRITQDGNSIGKGS